MNRSDGEEITTLRGAGMTLARIKENTVSGSETITYIHTDHLGSSSAATDTSGQVLWTEHHSPFGEVLNPNASNDNLAAFTGHIRDADTGLTYMQARYYDPVGARFLSIDPVTFMDTGNPGYFNRYAYTMNDPINFIDPTGEYRCSDKDCEIVDQLVDHIVEARDNSEEGSEDREVLDGVLDALGEKGAEGSVLVEIDDTKTASGKYIDGSGVISISRPANTTRSGKFNKHSAARTAAHEGNHLEDYQKNGSVKTRQERHESEKRAYNAGNAVDRGHGRTASNSDLSAKARASVRGGCLSSNIPSCK